MDWIEYMLKNWGENGFQELPPEDVETMNDKENREYCRRMWIAIDSTSVAEYFNNLTEEIYNGYQR